jgi:hypothetical protein
MGSPGERPGTGGDGVAGRSGLCRAPRLWNRVLFGLRGVLEGHAPQGSADCWPSLGSAPGVGARWGWRGGVSILHLLVGGRKSLFLGTHLT